MSRRAHRVEWAEVARRDLFGIVDYLAGRNPDAAAATLETLQRKASTLRAAPHRGRLVPELQRLQMREYRGLIIAPYRLIYRISGHLVLVLGVFDSRRNLEDILLERLGR